MKLQPYPEYKDSGLLWLGDIPSHWEVRPLRTLLKQRNEKNRPLKTRQILSLSIAHGVTLYSHEGRGGNKSKSDLTAYKIARKGDIVLNSMNVVVGAVGLSKYTGAISPVYYALYPLSDNVNIHYYDAVFSNHTFQRYLLIYGKGILIKEGDSGKLNTIRMKISSDDLKTISLPLPTPEEQTAIARFLNWKTIQVKRFIRNRRRLIEVLNEQKQAIINQAVTRGLNPDAPLKPSGIDSIEDIPAHWEPLKIRRITKHHKQGFYTTKAYINSGVRLVRITDILGTRINWEGMPYVSISANDEKLFRVMEDDFLFARTGGAGLFARVIAPLRSAFASYLIRFRFNERIAPSYMELFLQSHLFQNGIQSSIHGGVNRNVHAEDIKNQHILIPPDTEQIAIVDHLKRATAVINTATSQAKQEIDTIVEYRTRLISDVVTGKVDVRHLTPAPGGEDLEETVEALEPLEEDLADGVVADEEPIHEAD